MLDNWTLKQIVGTKIKVRGLPVSKSLECVLWRLHIRNLTFVEMFHSGPVQHCHPESKHHELQISIRSTQDYFCLFVCADLTSTFCFMMNHAQVKGSDGITFHWNCTLYDFV